MPADRPEAEQADVWGAIDVEIPSLPLLRKDGESLPAVEHLGGEPDVLAVRGLGRASGPRAALAQESVAFRQFEAVRGHPRMLCGEPFQQGDALPDGGFDLSIPLACELDPRDAVGHPAGRVDHLLPDRWG